MNGQTLVKTLASMIIALGFAVPSALAGNGSSQPLSDVNLSRPDVTAQQQWEPLLRFANAPVPISDVQLSRGGSVAALPAAAPLSPGSRGFSWTAALIGAGVASALMLVSVTATLGLRTRRRIPAL